MLYLIGAGLLFVISIIVFIQGYKKEKLTIQQAAEIYRKQIGQITDNEYQKYQQLIKDKEKLNEECRTLEKERQTEQDRARQARDNTEQLLRSEQERLAAEISKYKEIECMKLTHEMGKRREELEALYNTKNQDLTRDYILKKAELMEEIEVIQSDLDNFKAKQDAVNAAILRQKELDEQEDFYSILVSENDKEDIQVLQQMDLKLHNRDAIPKLIWDLFIRRPCQEMIKRITGGRKISGIYKITNKKTGEAYVGKTTDISTRWQNHCKTVVGLEGAARTTLHNRLAKDGLWAYTWEILEQVDKDHLSAREAFYINLYDTTKQLNMKEGSKNGTQ